MLVHSLLTILAVIVAFYLGHKEAKRKGLNLDMFYNSALWMFAGALIFGRIAFLVFGSNYSDFDPANVLNFFSSLSGGFHSVGVILGGALGLLFYALYKKDAIKREFKAVNVFFANLADIWVLGAAIGTFFYRIGGFIGGLHPGIETTLPWAVDYYGKSVHPVTLYYSMAGLFIFVVLCAV